MTVIDADRAEGLRLLRESAGAISPRGGSLAAVRALRDSETGFDRAVLAEMGGLGWLGLRVPDASDRKSVV